jgi:hypothetical protein
VALAVRFMAAAGLAAAVLAAATTACTPEEQRIWNMLVEENRVEGDPCPEVSALRTWLGLPEHFDVVIWRESTCDPYAVSPAGALGLAQIMPFWLRDLCPLGIACTRDDLFDPIVNLRAAAYVYHVQGPEAWSQTW